MYHIARKFCEDFKFGDVAYHDNIANLNTQFSCGNVTFLLYVFMYVCDHPNMDCVPFLSVAALIPAAAPPVCELTSGQTLTPAEGPASAHTHHVLQTMSRHDCTYVRMCAILTFTSAS